MAKTLVNHPVADHAHWHPGFTEHDAIRSTVAPTGARDRQAGRRADLAALAAVGVTYLMLVKRTPSLVPCPHCRPLLGRTCLIGEPPTAEALDCAEGCLAFAPLYLE